MYRPKANNDGCSEFSVSVLDGGRFSARTGACFKPRKRGDYLYEVAYTALDYKYAREYFRSHNLQTLPSGCSSCRVGNFYGRNLDWYYDNLVDFVVRTTHTNSHYASIGVAGSINGLDRAHMESGMISSNLQKMIPFYMLDGINEKGVFCNTNVVPTDKGPTIRTIPEVSEEDTICTIMVVRYVLDRFDNATDAVEYLRDHVSVYAVKTLQDLGYEAHYMIGDANHTYVLELAHDHIVFHEHNIMTNFHIDGVTFNEDGKVYTPADVPFHYASDNGITPFGSGLERYNHIVDHLSTAGTKDGMRALMNGLLYTQTYLSAAVVADPIWHTEYVGRLTVDDPASDFEEVEERYAETFLHRDRNTPPSGIRTWQTTHSSVYDLESRKLYIVIQEDTEKEYSFALEDYYMATAPSNFKTSLVEDNASFATEAVPGSEFYTKVQGSARFSASFVCTIDTYRYLRVEPVVIWVSPSYSSVTHVDSNAKWKIE